jgi:hypothetical protein
MLVVEYRDEGLSQDVDAYSWRVAIVRSDRYLGVAVGTIDGRSILRAAPSEEPDRSRWFAAGPLAMAEQLAERARQGTLRIEWELAALQLHLSADELQALAGDRDHWQTGDIVAEVDA